MHGTGFRDVLPLAHTAGDDGDRVRIPVQVIQGPFQPAHQREGGALAVNGGAEHDEIRTLRIGIGSCIFDDRDLDDAEVNDSETGQAEHDAPEQQREKTVGENQRNQEKAEIAPVDIAAQRKAEETAQSRKYRAENDPDRVFFLLFCFLLRRHHSEPPNVHIVP